MLIFVNCNVHHILQHAISNTSTILVTLNTTPDFENSSLYNDMLAYFIGEETNVHMENRKC
jgi:hypothetical protein